MDSCTTSLRLSEESERARARGSEEEKTPRLKRAGPGKSNGPICPDGTAWSVDDDEPARPQVRTRDDRPVLLKTEATQLSSQAINTRIAPPSVTLPAAPLLQSGPPPVSAQAVDKSLAQSPAKAPQSKAGVPATDDELHGMLWRMRERAMSTYVPVKGMKNRFADLFEDDIYAHIDYPSRLKAFKGNLLPICSKNTPERHHQEYYDEVSRLYKLNYGDAGAERLESINAQLLEFDTPEEKKDYLYEVLDNLIWKLTPNQRHGLRQEFWQLYGNSTIQDDTNWMFFDTIIRLYTMDERRQRSLVEKVLAAPKETRLKERERLLDKIHSRLSKTQRSTLKRVCRERYDRFMYSRLPLFQLVIREKNYAAMIDYVNAVVEYVPPEQRYRFLMVRCSNSQGIGNGDAAFFNIVQWGTPRMMRDFLLGILEVDWLTVREKWHILSAFTKHDRTSAFHMIMAAGDFDLAKVFVEAIITYLFEKDDFMDAFCPRPTGYIHATKTTIFDPTHYEMIAYLLAGLKHDVRRNYKGINAYTQALEHGHKKFAKKFHSYVKRMNDVFIREFLILFTENRPIRFGDDGKILPEDVKRDEENNKKIDALLAKVLAKEGPEAEKKFYEEFDAWEKNLRANGARQAAIRKAREDAKKEGRVIVTEKLESELWRERNKVRLLQSLQIQATFAYAARDARVAFANYCDQRSVKRQAKLAPLKSAAKALASPFTPDKSADLSWLTPTSPYATRRSSWKSSPPAKPQKRPRFRMPDHNTPSRYVQYDVELMPDGSPKPQVGPYLGRYANRKKSSDKKKNGGQSGYAKLDDKSEGG